MNLLTRLLRPAAGRAIDASQFDTIMEEIGGSTHARVRVDQASALRFVTVYACTNLIADAVASMPGHSYRREANRRVLTDRQPRWLDEVDGEANPETDCFTFKHRLLVSLLLDGNGYLFLGDRDNDKVPAELWNLHPSRTTPFRRGGQILFQYQAPGGAAKTYSHYSRTVNPDGQVLQIKGFDNGDPRGLSPIDTAREAVALGMAAEEYGARFFGQGAIPPGMLILDGAPNEQALQKMSEWFRANYSGQARAHVPAVVTGAKWEQISINPEQAQFLETRKYQVAEIARLFRVPPHLIGDVERSTSWGTGIGEQNRMFFQITLIPWVRRLESALSSLLPRGEFVRLDPAGLLRGDLKARYAAYKIGREGGWLSSNDIRRLEDMEPVEGGDEYLRPMNTEPINGSDDEQQENPRPA